MAQSNASAQKSTLVNPEDQKRILQSAHQIAGYTNFLRWAANFKKDEILKHPQHDQVILLSPMQSGRFSFAIEDDTVLLGIQAFESAWFSVMPFECAYVSDRLYLYVNGVSCMDAKMSSIGIGIFVDDLKKRQHLAQAKWIKPVHVFVENGQVTKIGAPLGQRFPIRKEDIISSLVAAAKNRLKQQDLARFF